MLFDNHLHALILRGILNDLSQAVSVIFEDVYCGVSRWPCLGIEGVWSHDDRSYHVDLSPFRFATEHGEEMEVGFRFFQYGVSSREINLSADSHEWTNRIG